MDMGRQVTGRPAPSPSRTGSDSRGRVGGYTPPRLFQSVGRKPVYLNVTLTPILVLYSPRKAISLLRSLRGDQASPHKDLK
eukprot:2078282-Pyramimonas_sp.AAC.2